MRQPHLNRRFRITASATSVTKNSSSANTCISLASSSATCTIKWFSGFRQLADYGRSECQYHPRRPKLHIPIEASLNATRSAATTMLAHHVKRVAVGAVLLQPRMHVQHEVMEVRAPELQHSITESDDARLQRLRQHMKRTADTHGQQQVMACSVENEYLLVP